MNVVSIVIIVLLAVFSIVGLIVGLCKGFSHVKSWGVEYLLASLLTIGIGGAVSKNFTGDNAAVGGFICIGLALVFINAFSGTSALFRKIFRSSKRKKIAKGGKKKGASGFVDRIFGGVTLAVKGFVITGFTASFILVVLDLSHIPLDAQTFGAVYESAAWTAFKPYLMDFLYIGVLMAAIKCGYQSGISNALWTLVVIGLVVFAGYVAYNLAFNVQAFGAAAQNIAPKIMELLGEMGNEELALNLAKWALTVGVFLLELVVVILVAVFVPKFLNFARNSKAFYAVDGVLGAVFAIVFAAGLLMLAGSIIQPISDLEIMAEFTAYFEKSAVATYFYDKNIISLLTDAPLIPIRDYFVSQQ